MAYCSVNLIVDLLDVDNLFATGEIYNMSDILADLVLEKLLS